MPELPEVETVKNGLVEHALGHSIESVQIRQPSLRWPVEQCLAKNIQGQTIKEVQRRAKYIIIQLDSGAIMVHLGMSGAIYFKHADALLKKHDHIILSLSNSTQLRYHDPRRFGSWHWLGDGYKHRLLDNLGPEPLSEQFSAEYLYAQTRKRQRVIKAAIMDQQLVVGVGNIYAAEALFMARIHPLSISMALTKKDCAALVKAIKYCLEQAIIQGGTTLRDFVNTDNKPGYFKQKLAVYGKEGESCSICNTLIASCRISQRASAYCENCQRMLK